MKRQTVATLPLLVLVLVLVLLGVAGGLSAPSVSASSLVSGQKPRHQHQPAVDRVALMALYDSAGGDNWTTSTNWDTNEPIGTWFGVTADSTDRVTRLDLRGNSLAGALPDELGNLTGLTHIYLQDNELTGPIPALSGLTGLTRLDLAHQTGQNREPSS